MTTDILAQLDAAVELQDAAKEARELGMMRSTRISDFGAAAANLPLRAIADRLRALEEALKAAYEQMRPPRHLEKFPAMSPPPYVMKPYNDAVALVEAALSPPAAPQEPARE